VSSVGSFFSYRRSRVIQSATQCTADGKCVIGTQCYGQLLLTLTLTVGHIFSITRKSHTAENKSGKRNPHIFYSKNTDRNHRSRHRV